MVTFTVTDTEDDSGWTIVAVPENDTDVQFLREHSPSSERGNLKLVLRHALEAVEDAGHPAITARVEEALDEAERTRVPASPRQEALPLEPPALRVLEGCKG